jgi:predicted dienelactone hydrolase
VALRPSTTLVWYPAVAVSPAESLTIGPPGDPWFFAGVAAGGARIASEGVRRPLVILSHGTGGSAMQMAWLGTALAREGYIVAAVNHHGNSGADMPYDPRGFVLWWERVPDLTVVINRMLSDSTFGPNIDPERIVAAGFSLGGYTVAALAPAGALISRASWPSVSPRSVTSRAAHNRSFRALENYLLRWHQRTPPLRPL